MVMALRGRPPKSRPYRDAMPAFLAMYRAFASSAARATAKKNAGAPESGRQGI
jgi:hypothetical protein